MRHGFAIILMILILAAKHVSAQFIVSINSNPTQLVQNGLIGPGVQASNVTGQLATGSAAIFTAAGVTGFPFTNGIVLTTGDLSNSLLGSSNILNSVQSMLPGDATLDALVMPFLTEDAAVLEFEFAVASDSLEFDFIFSSEEYNEWVNSNFNDVFGFFVTGPGYMPNTNVALLPGTTTTISINNVNNGGPAPGLANGPCMNCSYFIDNAAGAGAVGLNPDGFTVPITIKFPVQPCSQYHFKIALADVNDGSLDSQIFLKEGSFQACPLMQLMANNTYVNSNDTVWICPGESVILSSPAANSYSWSTGDTTQNLNITQAGTYMFYASNLQTGCFAYAENVITGMADSVPIPNLTGLNDTIYSDVTQTGLTYTWMLNGIQIPGAYQPFLASTQAGCYTLTVTNQAGCSAESNVFCLTSLAESIDAQVIVRPHPVLEAAVLDLPFGAGTATTVELFDIRGQLMKTILVDGATSVELNRNGLASGLYLLVISETGTQRKVYSKVVVQ
jgi:hypothetical protein